MGVTKLTVIICLAASLLSGASLCLADDFTNVQTSFVERGVLTSDEVSNVIRLAKQCGLEQAVSIRTYHLEPTNFGWNFGIKVQGRDIVSGRRVSYMTVDVYRHEAEPISKLKSLGKFWVPYGGIQTNDLAIFVISNRTFRVYMPRTLPLETADKIIKAFSERRIDYTKIDSSSRKEVEQYDFSTPYSIVGPSPVGTYNAAESHDSSTRIIIFTLDGDTVRINGVCSPIY